ncbi:MAG TPA: Pvc16 family protein [Blastocatellia bacterium]|nr:Pvc16 family protein [Blastocatellia bacterium]
MIRDLSETLRAMLDDPALAASFPELAEAQIVFDRPTDQFKPSGPTIDLFLYDVRENMELRSNEPLIERQNGQAVIHRPPMRVACSYLVTAWPSGVADVDLREHRLLSQVLMAISSHSTIPAKYLKGSLVGQQPPLPMMLALADGLKNPSEFWTSLGNKLRPSLNLTVTISMQTRAPEIAEVVTASEIHFGERTSPGEQKIKVATLQGPFRIVGRVIDADDVAVKGAAVSISQLGLSTTTDDDGRYSFDKVPPGEYDLQVESESTVEKVSITVPAPAGSDYKVKLPG